MEESEKANYDTEAQSIRGELKAWESNWANSHEGRKPGRDDIKQNQDIGKQTLCVDETVLQTDTRSAKIQTVQQAARHHRW